MPIEYQSAVDGFSSMKSDMAGIGEPTVGRPAKGDTCHIDAQAQDVPRLS